MLSVLLLGGASLAQTNLAQTNLAQTNGALLGTWRLSSAVATTASGERDAHPYGAHPSGLLSYMPDGRMTAMIAYDGRPSLSGDRVSAPGAERAAAFATFFAYAGRYEVRGDRVTHHVEIASVPNWVGTDLVRVMALQGDRLTLSTPPLSVGGRTQSTELVWERAK
ncbi:MAG: lipocalin-like domain-containing protein [Phenylobacterium sp.]